MAIKLEENERATLYNFAISLLGRLKAKKIGDMASGSGEGAHAIAEKFPQAKIIAIDLDTKLVDLSQKTFQLKNIEYQIGNVVETKYSENAFDAIVSFHTIEHLNEADQHKFVTELFRILKPGGALLIATPDREVWEIQGIAGIQDDHVRELSQKEFIDIIFGHGFIIEDIYGQNVLKDGNFPLRRFLNFLKKLDVLKIRRLLKKTVDNIDARTHPVSVGEQPRLLTASERASTTFLFCRKLPLRENFNKIQKSI